MSAPENKAVFLSYASQDAEAARRICDALRAASIEVWLARSARSFEFAVSASSRPRACRGGVWGLELRDWQSGRRGVT